MSRSQFYSLEIKNINKNTADCVVIEFNVPYELKNKFAFKAGQYLTLRAKINSQEVRRSYSLCSSPKEDVWKVGIKQIDGGLFSTYANNVLKVGDILDVMTPTGSFTIETNKENDKNYLFFAAGSGITPILSLIKSILIDEPHSNIKLFYANKRVKTIILKEELEALKNTYMERFEIFYFLTKEKRNIPFLNGRIDDEKLNIIFSSISPLDNVHEVMSCGPEQMILSIESFLLNKGFDKKNIHFELFTTSGESQKIKKQEIKKKFSGKSSNITILEGGKSFSFEMAQGENNILDEALFNSADLPFACKGGVCATCKCKLVEGDVEMLLKYGLEDDEVEAGYILSCQSIPITKKVTVDFDI